MCGVLCFVLVLVFGRGGVVCCVGVVCCCGVLCFVLVLVLVFGRGGVVWVLCVVCVSVCLCVCVNRAVNKVSTKSAFEDV